MTHPTQSTPLTLEAITARREQMEKALKESEQKIARGWQQTFEAPPANTRREKLLAGVDQGLAIFQGVMMGIRLIRAFRSLTRRH